MPRGGKTEIVKTSKKYYDNDDWSLPQVWGPPAWYVIHQITKNLLKLDLKKMSGNEHVTYQEAIEDLFYSLLKIIPCSICQNHYQDLLVEDSFYPYLDNWKKLDEWGFQLHNRVNKLLHKPIFTTAEYQKMYGSNKKIDYNYLVQFPDIVGNLYIEPGMSLSEIQDLKTFLNALVVLYPSRKSRTYQQIQKDKKNVKSIYDYKSLSDYYQTWIRLTQTY